MDKWDGAGFVRNHSVLLKSSAPSLLHSHFFCHSFALALFPQTPICKKKSILKCLLVSSLPTPVYSLIYTDATKHSHQCRSAPFVCIPSLCPSVSALSLEVI